MCRRRKIHFACALACACHDNDDNDDDNGSGGDDDDDELFFCGMVDRAKLFILIRHAAIKI